MLEDASIACQNTPGPAHLIHTSPVPAGGLSSYRYRRGVGKWGLVELLLGYYTKFSLEVFFKQDYCRNTKKWRYHPADDLPMPY